MIRRRGWLLCIAAAALAAGCERTLVYGERTGVNIGIRSDAALATPIGVNIGLERRVAAIVPAARRDVDGEPVGEAVNMISRFNLIDGDRIPGSELGGRLRVSAAFASGNAAYAIATGKNAGAVVAAIVRGEDLPASPAAFRSGDAAGGNVVQTGTAPRGFDAVFDLGSWAAQPDFEELARLQGALCMDATDIAQRAAGPRTRNAVAIAEATIYEDPNQPIASRNGLVDEREFGLITGDPRCPSDARNYFEKQLAPEDILAIVDRINGLPGACLPRDATLAAGGPLRARIAALRTEFAADLSADAGLGAIDDALTPAFRNVLDTKFQASGTPCTPA